MSDSQLWIDPAGWRYFRLPAGVAPAPGDLLVRSLDGRAVRADLAALAPYGVSAADATDEIDEAVEEAFGYILGALASMLGIEGAAADGTGDWTLDDVDPARAEARIVRLFQEDPAAFAVELDRLMQAVGGLVKFLDCLPIGHEIARTVKSLADQMRPVVDAIDGARRGDEAMIERLFALLAIIAAFDEPTGGASAKAGETAETAETAMQRVGQEIRGELDARAAARPAVSWDFNDLMKPKS